MSYKGQFNNLCEHLYANYVNLKKPLISEVTWKIFKVSVSTYIELKCVYLKIFTSFLLVTLLCVSCMIGISSLTIKILENKSMSFNLKKFHFKVKLTCFKIEYEKTIH